MSRFRRQRRPSSSGDDEDDQARRLSEAARQGDRAALTQVLLSTALTFIDEKIADSPVSVPMTQTRLVDIVRSIPDCMTQLAEEHLVNVSGPLIQEIFAEGGDSHPRDRDKQGRWPHWHDYPPRASKAWCLLPCRQLR